MSRVVIPERIAEEALGLLSGLEVLYDPNLYRDRAELKRQLENADALIVRNETRVDAELLASAPRLRVVGRLGVGLDNLERPALAAYGVSLTWAPGSNAISVAEYVVGAMLSFARRFADISSHCHQGGWDRWAATGGELGGKRLGVVGLGDIGSRLARRARAFDLAVLAHDPALHAGSFAVQELGVKLEGLDELLATSDFVSLHAPLTPGTRHLIGAPQLERMKRSAFLINTARGGLVDERALAAALREGRLAGAALDVRETEPPGDGDPLRGLPNVLLTPHIAGVTAESNRRASLQVAQDVLRVLSGLPPQCPAPGL